MSSSTRNGEVSTSSEEVSPPLGSALFTPDLVERMVAKLRPDPVTGNVEWSSINNYIRENFNDPDVQRIMSTAMDTMAQHDQIDVSDYDFASLVPEPNAMWQFYVEDNGHSTPVNKRFAFICIGSRGEPRHVFDSHEMPESPAVLKFIRDAIANRPYPITPSLPEIMLFSPEYAPYVPAIQPFLDALPRPLQWTLETPEYQAARDAISGMHDEFRGAKYLDLVQQCKDAGKLAYERKNRAGALDAFAAAVDHAMGALKESGNPAHRAGARRALAVCWADRAAALLMEGPDMDAKEALDHAQKAEVADPTYVKAYHRQARAHEILGDVEKAREVMRRAMQKPGLQGERSLREQLSRLEAR